MRIPLAPVGAAALAPLLVLVAAGCSTAGSAPRTAALVPEGAVEADAFPTVLIAWCDAMPRQIDIGEEYRYRTDAEFDDHLLEVDLGDPGEDWSVSFVNGDGSHTELPGGPIAPLMSSKVLAIGVGSKATEGAEPTEHDLGVVHASTGRIREQAGSTDHSLPAAMIAESSERRALETVPLDEFEPDC